MSTCSDWRCGALPPELWRGPVPGRCPAVRRGGVALRPAEEGLWPVSRRGGQRLHLPGPVPADAGGQAPVQSLYGERKHEQRTALLHAVHTSLVH